MYVFLILFVVVASAAAPAVAADVVVVAVVVVAVLVAVVVVAVVVAVVVVAVLVAVVVVAAAFTLLQDLLKKSWVFFRDSDGIVAVVNDVSWSNRGPKTEMLLLSPFLFLP